MNNDKPVSELEKSLLDAIAIIAKGGIDKAKIPATIECTVVGIEDAGNQLYKVEYMNNIFNAISSSGSYAVGDVVYVHIPEGDFSKTKIIIGAVESLENIVEDAILDEYIEISDDLLEKVWGEEPLSFCSYQSEIKEYILSQEFITYLSKAADAGDTSYILSAKFKTTFPLEQQKNGNYGIQLYIPILQDPGTGEDKDSDSWKQQKIINLDKNSIQGNPYGLTEQSFQSTKQTLLENAEIDTSYTNERKPKIVFFTDDNFIQNEEKIEKDIFIKEISFKNIAYLTEEQQSGYHLSLVADTGRFFLSNSDSEKTLIPKLKINGKESKVNEVYECYQFKENNTINQDSPTYSIIAGIGQECLNPRTNVEVQEDGRETFQQVTNIYTQSVKKEDIKAKVQYKCVLINMAKGIRVGDASIVIVNNESTMQFSLTSASGSNAFIKDVGEVELVAKLDWEEIAANDKIKLVQSRIKPGEENNLLSVEDFKIKDVTQTKGHYEAKITFPVSIVEDINVITCSIYRDKVVTKNGISTTTGQEFLILDSITITTSAQPEQRIVIQNGDVLYKYDSNGNSPFVEGYAYPYQSQKVILPLSYRIFKPDGTELTENEYKYCKVEQLVPNSNTLINPPSGTQEVEDDFYVVTDGELKYTIDSLYNSKATRNYIILRVTFRDIVLTEEANLKIVKEGETGTNGSRYSGLISFVDGDKDYTYEEIDDTNIKRLQLAYIQNKGWYQNNQANIGDVLIPINTSTPNEKIFNFKTRVYCDGQPIDSSKYSVSQSLFDSFVTNPILSINSSTGQAKIKRVGEHQTAIIIDENSEFCTVIQAEIKVGNETDIMGGSQETIYAHYPIEVAYLRNTNTEEIKIPYIANGFTSVVYASDGTNPSYDSRNPFKVESASNLLTRYPELKTSSSYKQICSQGDDSNIFPSGKDNEQEFKAIPVTKFMNGNSLNYVKVDVKPISGEKQKIENKKSEAEIKKANANNNINILNKQKVNGSSSIKNFYEKMFYPVPGRSSRFHSLMSYFIIDNASSFLKYRTEILLVLEDIINYTISIKDVIKEDYIKDYNLVLTNLLSKREELQLIGEQNKDTVLTYISNLKNIVSEIKSDQIELPAEYYISGTGGGGQVTIGNTPLMGKLTDTYTKPFDNYKKDYNNKLETFKTQVSSQQGPASVNSFLTGIAEVKAVPASSDFNNQDFNELINFNKFQDIAGQKDKWNSIVYRIYNPLLIITHPIPASESERKDFDPFVYIDELKELYGDEYPLYDNYNRIYDVIRVKLPQIFLINSTWEESSNSYVVIINSLFEEQQSIYDENNKLVNDFTEILDQFNSAVISIWHPIVMLFNIYEMSNLMGWDGNKLYIDENNEQYLLAPQIGAGKKSGEGNKLFTGIVMGVRGFAKDSEGKKKSSQTGLFAYNENVQTYFLNAEDGSAIMGKAHSGQIIIDPKTDKGLIYSSTFQKEFDNTGKPKNYYRSNENGEGMIIDLTTPEIRFGNGKFSVDKNGQMVAKGGGRIGGQTIGDSQLYSNIDERDGRITLDSGYKGHTDYGYQFVCYIKNNEQVVSNCILYHNEITNNFSYINFNDTEYIITSSESYIDPVQTQLKQKIIANSKTDAIEYIFFFEDDLSHPNIVIADKVVVDKIDINDGSGAGSIYSHSHYTLDNTTEGFYLSYNGLSVGDSIRIESAEGGKILVGRVKNKDKRQTISGDNERSYIAYGGDTAYSDATTDEGTTAKVYIGTDGISIGKKFSINDKGELTAYKGNIGGQNISKDEIASDKIHLKPNGSIYCGTKNTNDPGQIIDNNGSATFKNIHIKGGDLDINNKNAQIESNGNATFKNITCNSIFVIQDDNGNKFTNDSFNFGMGDYGSLANGGFSFIGGGTSFGSAGTGGLTMAEDTTYVKKNGNSTGITTYIENLSVGQLTAKGVLVGTPGNTHTITMENGKITADSIDVDSIIAKIANLDYLQVKGLRIGTADAPGTFYHSGYYVSRQQKDAANYVLGVANSPG